jgi:hypothetical protein
MAKARFHAHIRPQSTVGENARRIIRARLAELSIWAQYVQDEARAREQHQLRIAAKRLRYTLELFKDYLPEQAGEAIKELKGIQDALGLLHDCDVLIAILRSALFVPEGETTLFERVPAAQDLPTSLLEVLGQPAQENAQRPAIDQPALSAPGGKQKKRGNHGYKNGHKRKGKDKSGKRHNRQPTSDAPRSRVRPRPEERAGLERFLAAKEEERTQLYQHFVRRWEKLEKRDFRAGILHLVEASQAQGRLRLSTV